MAFTLRHAASPSLDARTSRPWDGRSSRKCSWLAYLISVSSVRTKKLNSGCHNKMFAVQRYHRAAVADYVPKARRAATMVRVTAMVAAGFE
jgi:hypothetical protein